KNLIEMGNWLKKNGEAVYNTVPWFLYGEGSNEIEVGNYSFHHNNHFAKIQYSKEDIRFTVNGDYLYATCLGKPDGDLSIATLNSSFKLREGDIVSITHLDSGKEIEFDHTSDALVLKLEGIPLDDKANAFKIKLNFKI
ncbi:MAG: hypothetical protein WBN28_11960, partial [Lutimonas sp.]